MTKVMRTLAFVAAVTCFKMASAQKENPETKLPEFFTICKRYDPQLDSCIRDSIQKIIPSIKDGAPALSIPVMDPYTVSNFKVDFSQDDIRLKINAKKVSVVGLSKTQIKSVRSNVTDTSMHILIEGYIPEYIFDGTYKAKGGYNLFLVDARGRSNITLRGVTITWEIAGHTVERNGEEYLKIDKFTSTPAVIEGMKVYLTGLFPDNPVLEQVVGALINENWHGVYQALTPHVARYWNNIVNDASGSMFETIPYSRLLPKN